VQSCIEADEDVQGKISRLAMYSAFFLFTRLLERVLGSATPSTWRTLTVGNNSLHLPLLLLQFSTALSSSGGTGKMTSVQR
jgi:hypothetical protein